MNNCSFIGRLTADSEYKEINGKELLEFTVANNIGFGENKDVIYLECKLWGKRAKSLKQYLNKGQQVGVTGQLKINKWTSKVHDKEYTDLILTINDIDLVGGAPNKAKECDANGELVF